MPTPKYHAMGQIIAKKGFIYYLKHKKWKITDFLEPLLALPFAFITIIITKEGLTPINVVIALAGTAYLTLLFRFYKK